MGGRSAVPAALAVWAGMLAAGAHAMPAAPLIAVALAALAAAALADLVTARAPVAARSSGRVADLTPSAAAGGDPSASRGRRDGAGWALALALLALAVAGAARHEAHRERLETRRAAVAAAALHRLTGVVAEPPPRESGHPVAVIAVRDAEPPLDRGARVRLRLPPGAEAEWGDVVEAIAALEPPEPPRNPGGADPRAIARANAIVAGGRAYTAIVVDSGGLGPRATAARWRRAVEGCFAARLSPEARELVTPLVTGDRTAMSADLVATLRASGLVHLIALSGLHVAWMAGVVRGVVAALGGGVRARAIAGIACALAYVGVAGPLPSLARAAVTECLAGAARLAERALDPLQALAVSALALLAAAPGWSGDLGFQLSCAATWGLVAANRPVPPRARGLRRFALETRGLLAGSIGAQLAAAPLLLARTYAIAWVAPLANLAAVPVSGLLLAGAWLAALADLAAPGAARVLFAACEALAFALRAIGEWSAALPRALVVAGSDPSVPVISGMAGAALLLAALPPQARRARERSPSRSRVGFAVVGAALAVAAIVAAATAPPRRPAADAYWVVVLDVGQGDAIALGFADGWWLVDAGPAWPYGDAGASRVLPFLRWAGASELGVAAITHGDRDHAGGVASMARALAARRWIAPAGAALPDDVTRAVPELARVARGDTLRAAPVVRVLWPPPALAAAPAGSADNHGSLALAIGDAAGATTLLLADVDAAAERALAIAGPVAVLKAAHHGSRTSTSADLVERARPRHAAISCGRDNRYGHPHPVVVARLAASGAAIARTDREGALWYEAGARGVRRVDWRAGAWSRDGAAATRERPVAPRPRE